MSEDATLKRKLEGAEATDAKKLKLEDLAAQSEKPASSAGELEEKSELAETNESSSEKKESTSKDDIASEEPAKALAAEKEKEKPQETRPVFGATSSFGNASIFDKMKKKTNVFDGLPSSSEKKETLTSAFGSSSVSGGSFGSSFGLFGASSKFANALQKATEKKSFLDNPEDDTSEAQSASTTPKPSQQYKQVELVAQDVKTGEENEKSLYSVTAKLFELDLTKISEGWKERGLGPLHLNQSLANPAEVRLVMRSQGLLRVVLNYRITQTTVLIKGLEASLSPGKFLRFNSVSGEGKPVQYLLKFGNETLRDALVDVVNEVRVSTKSNGGTAEPSDRPSTQDATDEDTGDEH